VPPTQTEWRKTRRGWGWAAAFYGPVGGEGQRYDRGMNLGSNGGAHVLVTGAAGYLGSILCERLLAANHRVTALDSLVHEEPSLLHLCAHPRFAFVRGDVRDESLMHTQLRAVDAVIPLAAL